MDATLSVVTSTMRLRLTTVGEPRLNPERRLRSQTPRRITSADHVKDTRR